MFPGVAASVATVSGEALNLTKIADAGQTIPADNAVILKANAQNFTLTPSNETAMTVAEKDLLGTDTDMPTPSDPCYVLSGEDGKVGFYHFTGAGGDKLRAKHHHQHAVVIP